MRRRRRDGRQVAAESFEVRRHARRTACRNGVANVIGRSIYRRVAAASAGHGVRAMRLDVHGGL